MSTDHRIVTAKMRLSLRKIATRTTTIHYDWALLNNRDVRNKYALAKRNKYDALQEQTHTLRMKNMRISSRQRNSIQQNKEENIESHGKH